MPTPQDLIALLNLHPHPKEGGHFRETYRCPGAISKPALPNRYPGPRAHSTAIYYLLMPGTFSAVHRLASDEVFHFYLGDPVRMLQLNPDGNAQTIVLGPDIMAGQHVQTVVPRGVWQGSILEPGGRFALLGCTVAPGFDYADYEGVDRQQLLQAFPRFADLIMQLSV